ncbi:TPA: tetratricopeptide repeat protein, partial [Candidatus Bipolaricaulota bacterium]|nr:tetratricopeptide repeat protein [Candidatus Bipolaricaulota bacterium]
ERHDYVSAQERLKEILELDPRFERALILLGDIYRNTYRYEEAKGYYQRALQVIDRKIARLERKLAGEVTAEEYGAIRTDLARLRQQREGVVRSLAQLP